MRNKKLRLLAGLTALALVATVGVVMTRAASPISVTLTPHPAFAMAGNTSVADVAERVIPSVVNISTTGKRAAPPDHPFFRDLFRNRRPRRPRGLGSGVIVSTDGLVVTNNHVVAKADKIRVTLWDKREYSAKVLGTDPKSDLAILRLKGAKRLKPIAIGDSDKLRLGDVVLAVGNPFGVGQTVTMGIVSAKGRANVGIVAYEDFIQTDAAINPGNSGGALINMRGELVGINTAILSRSGGYQGIGFAIPTNMAKPITASLLKHGKVVRGWLGVGIQQVTPDLARAMKLATKKGVLISHVEPTGPAKRAGIRRGDVVVRINGKRVTTTGRLRNLIASSGAKRTVKIEVYRNAQKKHFSVKLGELPARLGGTAGPAAQPSLGLSVAPLDSSTRNRFGISPRVRSGVVVTQVKRNSPAGSAGVQSGDVILEVNRVRIRSVRRFTQLFSAARGQVLLLVYRRGFSQYILIHK